MEAQYGVRPGPLLALWRCIFRTTLTRELGSLRRPVCARATVGSRNNWQVDHRLQARKKLRRVALASGRPADGCGLGLRP
jgi:hypothetical protein